MDRLDARAVGEQAEHRGGEYSHGEGESEEESEIIPTLPGTKSWA
jgi:hypothetical protein